VPVCLSVCLCLCLSVFYRGYLHLSFNLSLSLSQFNLSLPLCLSASLSPCLSLSPSLSLHLSPPHSSHALSHSLILSPLSFSHTYLPPPLCTHTLSHFQSSPIPVLKVVQNRDRGYVLLSLQERGGQLLSLMQARVRLHGEGYSNTPLVVGVLYLTTSNWICFEGQQRNGVVESVRLENLKSLPSRLCFKNRGLDVKNHMSTYSIILDMKE